MKNAANLLKAKMMDFASNIPNDEIRDLIIENGIVAGGAIASIIQGDTPKDYDTFITNKEALGKIKGYYHDLKKSNTTGVNYGIQFISESAITLFGDIQIVTSVCGTEAEILETFDFLHCKALYNLREDKVYIPDFVLKEIKEKQLIYTGNKYPLMALWRVRKFLMRGYNIDKLNLMQIARDISRLDLSNPKVYAEQSKGLYPTEVPDNNAAEKPFNLF